MDLSLFGYFVVYLGITTVYGMYMRHVGFHAGIHQTLVTIGSVKSKAIQDSLKALAKDANNRQ